MTFRYKERWLSGSFLSCNDDKEDKMTKLNELIDQMNAKREAMRECRATEKQLKGQYDELELRLISTLDDVGTEYARGSTASATITEQTVPVIDDWGKVCEWIIDNDALYLVHRRVSSGPWKELQDAGQDVPGIEPFTKRGISLRKLSD